MKTSGLGWVWVCLFAWAFFCCVHCIIYKALLPRAYNRNSQFKWHNEQIYAIQLLCH